MTGDLREEIAIALFTGILYGGHRDEWDLLSDDPDTFPPTYGKNWYRCGAEDVMSIVRKAQAEAWVACMEYVKTQLREEFEFENKVLAKYPKPIGNSLVQPCRDAMDASAGPWGYREYDAHIATVQVGSVIDMLTVHPPMDIEGDHWDGDEDPNPYLVTTL